MSPEMRTHSAADMLIHAEQRCTVSSKAGWLKTVPLFHTASKSEPHVFVVHDEFGNGTVGSPHLRAHSKSSGTTEFLKTLECIGLST